MKTARCRGVQSDFGAWNNKQCCPQRHHGSISWSSKIASLRLHDVLQFYALYYNQVRTHRSLRKDAPEARPIQFNGTVYSRPVLGGLHHHYVRV